MWDDDKPKPKPKPAAGDDLKALSIAELEARVTAFEEEIARTRAEVECKTAHAKAAQSLFKD